MPHDVPAVFDHGVFRPLQPLNLAEGARVQLHIEEVATSVSAPLKSDDDASAARLGSISEFQKLMAELPIESPPDGFTGADHDQLLYGVP
jgi:predicted DNA-binding antitoxin AbrB/MazE fold protein